MQSATIVFKSSSMAVITHGRGKSVAAVKKMLKRSHGGYGIGSFTSLRGIRKGKANNLLCGEV